MRLALYLIREQGVILKSIGSSLFLIFVGRCSFWGGRLPSWKTGGMFPPPGKSGAQKERKVL